MLKCGLSRRPISTTVVAVLLYSAEVERLLEDTPNFFTSEVAVKWCDENITKDLRQLK
jgi:hypothetical protein